MEYKSVLRPPALIGFSTFAFTIILPAIVYFYKFRSYSISNQSSDWGAFSTYMSPFATLFSGIALFLLTWCIYRDQAANEKERNNAREANEKERAENRKAIEKERAALEKPLITFRRTQNFEICKEPFYEMINGGRSSALLCDVYIRATGSQASEPWDLKLICYTLIPREIINFPTPEGVSKIAVDYKDIYGNSYVILCENDKNSVVSNDQFSEGRDRNKAIR